MIQVKSKQSKELANSAQDQVAEMQEDLLKVKRERNISNSKIKTFQVEIEVMKSDNENLRIEKSQFAEEKKVYFSELKDFIKENSSKLKRHLGGKISKRKSPL